MCLSVREKFTVQTLVLARVTRFGHLIDIMAVLSTQEMASLTTSGSPQIELMFASLSAIAQ